MASLSDSEELLAEMESLDISDCMNCHTHVESIEKAARIMQEMIRFIVPEHQSRMNQEYITLHG